MGGKEKRSGETMKMVKKTDVSERLESLRIECERAFTKDEKDPEAVVKKYEIGTIKDILEKIPEDKVDQFKRFDKGYKVFKRCTGSDRRESNLS